MCNIPGNVCVREFAYIYTYNTLIDMYYVYICMQYVCVYIHVLTIVLLYNCFFT